MVEIRVARTDEARVNISCRMEGSTDSLIEELAAGMADAVVRIADDLPVVDEIHESLARVMASRMIDMVNVRTDLRQAPAGD